MKDNLSTSLKGKPKTLAHRQALSAAKKGKSPWNKGSSNHHAGMKRSVEATENIRAGVVKRAKWKEQSKGERGWWA